MYKEYIIFSEIKREGEEHVKQAALETGGDFSEIFVEDRYTNQMSLRNSV